MTMEGHKYTETEDGDRTHGSCSCGGWAETQYGDNRCELQVGFSEHIYSSQQDLAYKRGATA